ncbi:MAG: peptide chain release factor N(5)-glutamine methyltransferase [Endomicrobium sp.]|jgi:release factor glutamine methyltransferase|nr:peptide chain release factor N(5)-glutamine methyltransferase [Endomicrobium sp.]
MQNNVYSVLNCAKEFLRSIKIDDYKASAEELLSAVLKIKRSKLAAVREQKLTEKEISLFNLYIQRRAKREPAAYILGSCGFMGFEFIVNENVLIPRTETELLTEEVLRACSFEKERNAFCGGLTVLDLCAGCGCIAVSLSKLGGFKAIYALDISLKALEIAEKNAKINEAENIIFLQSDIFHSVKDKKFDIIVSNPPYVSESEYAALEPELKYEPQIALMTGEDGLFFYRRIARQAGAYLNGGGQIFLELNANKAEEIKDIFSRSGFKNIKIIKDYSDLPRILTAGIS